jgi:hypothetical protein
MTRATITPFTALGAYGTYGAGLADFTLTAANVSDKNMCVASNNDLIIAYNSDVTNPYTVTISSVADTFGRTGDITSYSLAAGDYVAFGPFRNVGWKQSDGKLYFEANNAAIKFAVIALNE